MPDRLLTSAQVADRFQFSERYLRMLVRRHGIRVLRSGRLIRFDDLAIRSLEEALRCHAQEDCGSRAVEIPAPSRSSVRLPGNAYESALNLTTVASPKKKPPLSRRRSSEPDGTGNVVALDRSGRR